MPAPVPVTPVKRGSMRVHSAFFVVTAATLLVTGCGGDSAGPDSQSYLGSYALVSVDGATLPITVLDTPTLKLTVAAGAWTLKPDNTFSEEIRTDVTANGFPIAPEFGICLGTYQRNGNTFTMTATRSNSCTGGVSTGTLDGRTLSVSIDGSTLVFRR